MPADNLSKFQHLLRRLFQFESADLDFGIYRILNFKRRQINEFITNRLPEIVDCAFQTYTAADRTAIEVEIDRLREQVTQAYGVEAVGADGQLSADYQKFPLGEKYREAQERVTDLAVADELKNRVYNDLYTFFNRYYDDGDFISRRRRGREETYAVPYNGEEVLLYWANRDQYYIKSGERFAAYRFQLDGFKVAVELQSADVEQNNNKGDKRYFILAAEHPVKYDENAKLLTIYFEHRPLTEAETIAYGKTEAQRPQEKLNEAAAQTILDQIGDMALKAALLKSTSTGTSALLKHLTQFSRRNSADFFIHKDLRGFLTRELDFFLKNDTLLLDELLGGNTEDDLVRHIQRARVIREVAGKIIDFLAQVEDFQKRLWEKKKFVVRTDYATTLDRVPQDFWPEVLANTSQVTEWQRLYVLDELLQRDGMFGNGLDTDFLSSHPALMIDTRHFSEEFKWRLLGSLDNLDDQTDGLLFDSENFHVLLI